MITVGQTVKISSEYIDLLGIITSVNNEGTMCKIKSHTNQVYSFYIYANDKLEGHGHAAHLTAEVVYGDIS